MLFLIRCLIVSISTIGECNCEINRRHIVYTSHHSTDCSQFLAYFYQHNLFDTHTHSQSRRISCKQSDLISNLKHNKPTENLRLVANLVNLVHSRQNPWENKQNRKQHLKTAAISAIIIQLFVRTRNANYLEIFSRKRKNFRLEMLSIAYITHIMSISK